MNQQKRKLTVILSITVLMVSLFANVAFAKVYPIKDVQSSDPSYDKIQWVLNQGYMGLTLGKFLPNTTVRRGEFTAILAKINGDVQTLPKPTVSSFSDVKVKDQFFRYIEAEKSLMTSFKSDKGKLFKPTSYLTREDACYSIVKVMGYNSDDAVSSSVDPDVSLGEIIADDNKISPALLNYATLAVQNELISLREDGSNSYLDPKKNITRKDLAEFIYNAYQNPDFNKMSDDDSSNSSTDSSNDDTVTD